jgi:hypothetical protein
MAGFDRVRPSDQNVEVFRFTTIPLLLRLMMVAAFLSGASIAHPILCVADDGHVAIELSDAQCDRAADSHSRVAATASHEKCSDTPLIEIPIRLREASGAATRGAYLTIPLPAPLYVVSAATVYQSLAPPLTLSMERHRAISSVPLRC